MIARAPIRSGLVYALVAGLCLGLHNGIVIGLDWLGAPLIAGVALSFAVVSLTGYALHSRFTFRQPMGIEAFARYALAMSANVPLVFVTIWLWRDVVGLKMLYASPLASGCMILMNFALSHWALARPRGA